MGKSISSKIFHTFVYFFAFVGFVLTAGYVGVRFGLTNTTGIIDNQQGDFLAGVLPSVDALTKPSPSSNTPAWASTEEWNILEQAIRRDAPAINRASADSGIPARLIAANLVAEQLRLFFTEREFYEQFFAPLKILGSQTQFSWGVMGMKEDTARKVEDNLTNPLSPFYPGQTYAHLLDFSTPDTNGERFTRMTDQENHYWSYLYAGVYLKEIETQWASAGFDISNRPDILSTLYNIGFTHSSPNPDPQVGGAEIEIAGTAYSFGRVAGDFYTSDLLTDVLPR